MFDSQTFCVFCLYIVLAKAVCNIVVNMWHVDFCAHALKPFGRTPASKLRGLSCFVDSSVVVQRAPSWTAILLDIACNRNCSFTIFKLTFVRAFGDEPFCCCALNQMGAFLLVVCSTRF